MTHICMRNQKVLLTSGIRSLKGSGSMGSTGRIVGYGNGLDHEQILLDLERAQ